MIGYVYNIHVEDYTDVMYIIHRMDVPSILCEMNLRWSKSITEVGNQFFYLR
jgi:hypothetical protein